MDHSSNDKLLMLDQIEGQVYQLMQSATQSLTEFSKDKPSIKSVESQVNQFLKALENVENGISKQIQYLSQVSTLQPHEGSSYASMKTYQLANFRLEHMRSGINNLENLKKQHLLEYQKLDNAQKKRMEARQNKLKTTSENA